MRVAFFNLLGLEKKKKNAQISIYSNISLWDRFGFWVKKKKKIEARGN